jgi:hypothetical protein
MNGKELKRLLAALKEQRWTWESTPNGHYKMWPPDSTLPMVCAAVSSNDINIMRIIIRDLRRSGFVWPSENGKQKAVQPKEKDMRSVSVSPAVEALRHTPTPSTPHTLPTVPVADSPDMDALFKQLKEARTYAELARDAREEAKLARDKAEEALRGSEKELEIAVSQLKSTKQAFDKAFGGGE